MKNIVKLNESQLRKVIAESIKKVLKESMGGVDYHAVLKNYGFEYMGNFNISWIDSELVQNSNTVLYFISVLTSEGLYHSKIYSCNERASINTCKKIVKDLRQTNWIQSLFASKENPFKNGITLDLDDEDYNEGATAAVIIYEVYYGNDAPEFEDGYEEENPAQNEDSVIYNPIGYYEITESGEAFWDI